MELKIYRQSIL